MKRPVVHLPPVDVSIGVIAYGFAVVTGTVLLWGDGDSRVTSVFAMIFLALFSGVPTFYRWERAADRADMHKLREQAHRATQERVIVPDYPPGN